MSLHRILPCYLMLASFAAIHALGIPLRAADDNSKVAQHIETVAQEAKRFVGTCEITTATNKSLTFQRQPEPCLRWSNPTAGEVYGDIYLYTNAGRPAAMISYYRWFSPDWGKTVEVHSFHPDKIVGMADGVRFWAPLSGGLMYATIADAETPAPNPAGRLLQMRRLADEFAVQLQDTRSNSNGVQRTLRRLTQPIYRFPVPTTDADYIDGALFAFVEGTDPELLLFLDAIPIQKAPIWRFAIARLNRDHIRVSHNDKLVWEAAYLTSPYEKPQEVYTTFNANSRLKTAP
jgi:hypothetical protein